jgi:hypothetical protein
MQALALVAQPVFEGWVVNADAGEQIALVKLSRQFERGGRALVNQPFELAHVHVECVAVQRDGIPIGNQQGAVGNAQCLAQLGKGLP